METRGAPLAVFDAVCRWSNCSQQCGPARACEYDGIPDCNLGTGQINADPFAGDFIEVIARDQREAVLERSRNAFVQRFGLTESSHKVGAIVTAAATAPNAGPN